jgi:hypothetical protein
MPEMRPPRRTDLPAMRARSGLPATAEAVRAGLASGRYVRGATLRIARGSGRGSPPVAGDLLIDDEVRSVEPPLGRGQQALAWEVVGHGRWTSRFDWEAQVVGIRDRGSPQLTPTHPASSPPAPDEAG